jgi:hypothetical protein
MLIDTDDTIPKSAHHVNIPVSKEDFQYTSTNILST